MIVREGSVRLPIIAVANVPHIRLYSAPIAFRYAGQSVCSKEVSLRAETPPANFGAGAKLANPARCPT